MKQIFAIFAIAVGFSVFADSAVSRKSDVNYTFSLNADWRFTKAPVTIPLAQAKASVETAGVKVESPSFDDSAWETVSLPHPVNAHDSFDDRAVDAGESSFFRGMMFYRKRFMLPRMENGKWRMENGGRKFFLEFETVRQTIYVWVNGKMVGYYEAGIAPTCYDISEAVREGENVICVATDNCAARGTKLFALETIPGHEPGDMSGQGWQWNTTDFNEVQGGLVGNVRLHVKPSTYLTLPFYNNLKTVGTYVTAKDFDFAKGSATIVVKAEVRNESLSAAKVGCRVSVVDPRTGKVLGCAAGEDAPRYVKVACDKGVRFLTALEADVYEKAPQSTRIVEPETAVITVEVPVKEMVFWSPDTPQLYDVKVELVGSAPEAGGGTVLDRETIRTGFRQVAYDATKGGLLINGTNVWLRGYAQRATDEWAAIGVAPEWLQDFDARLIRESNANFVRWMHVAPKPAPMRAFDKYGIVNACPAGDKEGDVSGRAWAQRMEAMRDVMIYYRNSPSVLFWEAGNNQISPAHMKEMREMKERLDPDGGRFMGSRTLQSEAQVAESEYVGTMLHRHELPAFTSMKKLNKFQPIMETEYARQESPRRCWDDFTPPHYDYVCRFLGGGKKETGYDVYDQTQEDFALSTAREYAEFYASRANGIGLKTYSACAALCWSDSNQHGRQSGSENCRMSGRVDPVRVPKMNFWTFRAMQSEAPAVKIVGHWNYPKAGPDTYWYNEKAYNGKYWAETGKKLQRDPTKKTVYVIGSPHVAKVELLVNGKTKGVCEKPDHLFVWSFPEIDVTESGVVESVAYDVEGKEIARDRIETAGAPAKLVLTPHTGPEGFLADGSDIAVIDLKLVDAQGRTCPLADNKVEFRVVGPATFMGGYNSGVWGENSPIGKNWVKLECGVNRVFVKAGREAGVVKVVARAARPESSPYQSGGRANTPGSSFEAEVTLSLKAVSMVNGLGPAPQAAAPNGKTYAPKVQAKVVQNMLGGPAGAIPYEVRVNGLPVKFALGAPTKPDDNTGVCCAYVPVLEALQSAGAQLEFSFDPKKIPSNKKWLRKLAPSPYQPMVTIKAGGKEIDACVGFTELFVDNGKDKNLTNCEVFNASKKKDHGVVCGELGPLLGYIPGLSVKVDAISHVVDIKVESSPTPSLTPTPSPTPTPALSTSTLDLHLILCIGQSNMAGRGKLTDEDRQPVAGVLKLDASNAWVPGVAPYHFDKKEAGVGPVDAFVKRYFADHPGVTVGVVPCAVGGTQIKSWSVKGKENIPEKRLADALERARIAKAKGHYVAILWLQGESDAEKLTADQIAARYPGMFKGMVEKVREVTGDVPVVAGEIGRWPRKGEDHAIKINPVLASIKQSVPFMGVVSSEGLTNQDLHHFDRASQLKLGGRFYDVWKGLWNDLPR